MKAKPPAPVEELRMKASDFDRIMRGVLAVTPPVVEKKARKKAPLRKKTAK